jgi:hypothetical protein
MFNLHYSTDLNDFYLNNKLAKYAFIFLFLKFAHSKNLVIDNMMELFFANKQKVEVDD